MITNLKSIQSVKQTTVKVKAFTLLKMLWFPLMVSLVFSSSLVLATQQRKKLPNITVKNITYKIDKETEKVIIELNRATTPIVFHINGNNPRIVIDIMDVLPCKGRYRTPIKGKLIKQIRAYYHKDSEKLRVVLDLYPGRDYVLSQLQISQKFLIELKPSENANFE
jgi:hypothetical protein